MGTTEEEVPLQMRGRVNVVGLSKQLARAVPILVPAILALGGALGGGVVAYRAAVAAGAEKVQASKNKSEAGFQVTKQALEELQGRVLVLERAAQSAQVGQQQARAHTARTRRPAPLPPPAVPVVVTTNPKALPRDLDRAEKQVYQGAPPRAVDAGP